MLKSKSGGDGMDGWTSERTYTKSTYGAINWQYSHEYMAIKKMTI